METKQPINKIGIIGAGFVGSACEIGFEKIPNIQIKIYDKYKDTESLQSVVDASNILFLCLPTPIAEDGSCDFSILEDVIEEINEFSLKSKILVIKSTVPPGTTARLAKKYDYHSFIFNPEFLTEKNFINDFLEQDRIILGKTKNDKGATEKLCKFYELFISNQKKPATIYVVDSDVAEMTKYSANCFLATKVIFFNEIFQICKRLNIDYNEVSKLTSLDKRIGVSHTKVPGEDGKLAFGGSCFPKDFQALLALYKKNNVDCTALSAIWKKNLLLRPEKDWKRLAQVTGKYKK